MKQYSSIEELLLTLTLYPRQKQAILEEASNSFDLDGHPAWFAVAEDGNCALFNENGNVDDLSKVKVMHKWMISENIKKINIPENVITIAGKAFYDNSQLEEVNMTGSKLRFIDEYAFCGCSKLKKMLFPDSVKTIGNDAFYLCSQLEEVRLSRSLMNLQSWAFGHCTSLRSIDLPQSIGSIDDYALFNCKSLTRIVVPEKCRSIGVDVFGRNYSLEEVVFKGKTFEEVQSMKNYPFGIEDLSIIKVEK